uniref:Aminotransferase-like plant mobile domain-containing protein n=1 Tax=Cajanus cajan TaxID=3821 RepID=A0A151QMM5_CAJCA|nr:hypothetical protein KK1_048078 [Cajanus cajan]
MSSSWVKTGIFEFIQLAKFDLHLFDPQMLLSEIFFWNRETRAFEFPCGFVCPTLLDIAVITGLTPLGDRFHPDVFEDEISIKDLSITWDKKTYLAFINAHVEQPRTPVSTSEHITFLMYWLSACVFCTPSLQSGMRQKDVRIYPYQPQMFARQFGLCQMKPLPLGEKKVLTLTSVSTLETMRKFYSLFFDLTMNFDSPHAISPLFLSLKMLPSLVVYISCR